MIKWNARKYYGASHEEIFRDFTFSVVLQLVLDGILIGIVGGAFASTFRYVLWYFEILRTSITAHVDFVSVALWLGFTVLMGFVTYRLLKWEPMSGGSGIPQIEGEMMGLFDMNAKRVLVAKYIGGALTSLGGFSVGREGPSIQVGGAAGKIVSQLLHRPLRQERILTSAGAATGLAAAFSAPISGAIFIFEEVHKSFYPALVIPTFTAVLVSNFVTSFLFGLGPSLNFTVVDGVPIQYFLYLIVLGLFIGFVGVLFNKCLLYFKKAFGRMYISNAFKIIFTFVCVAIIGYFAGDLLGGGNHLIKEISQSNGMQTILFLLFLCVGKIGLTCFCYGSGAQGGIFLPILVVGAAAGGLFYSVSTYFGMDTMLYLPNFVICAMGGILASSLRSPLLSILLVLEMTQSFSNTFAVGVVTIVAYLVAEMMKQAPIYDSLLALMVNYPTELEESQTFFEATIPVVSPMIGRSLKELSLPIGTMVVSITRYGQHIVPMASTVIQAEDVVYVSCRKDALRASKEYFMR